MYSAMMSFSPEGCGGLAVPVRTKYHKRDRRFKSLVIRPGRVGFVADFLKGMRGAVPGPAPVVEIRPIDGSRVSPIIGMSEEAAQDAVSPAYGPRCPSINC